MVIIDSGPANNYRQDIGRIIIPTDSNSFCKIIITDDSGTDYTVMDTTPTEEYSGYYGYAIYGYSKYGTDTLEVKENYTISASVTLVATSGVSSFVLKLANDEGRFFNIFDGGEYVKIYLDSTDASTLILHGRIDNVNYGLDRTDGFFVEIDGRECPELVDKTITGIQIGATIDSALGNILYENYNYIKLSFWNGTSWITGSYNNTTRVMSWDDDATSLPTTLVNIVYQNKKGISVISDILSRVGMDSYIYYDETEGQFYLRIFNSESINNSLGIAYGVNLIRASDYGKDNNNLFNRVIAFGKTESDNILLLKTSEDSASQAELWVKDKIINDSDSDTMELISDKADSELAASLVQVPNGRFTAIGLTAIRPGEVIEIAIPYMTSNGLHKVSKIVHDIDNVVYTTVDVNKKLSGISDLFKQTLNPDDITGEMSNINNMKDSYTIYFDSDGLMNHSGTEEIDGKLRLQDGEISGVATSNILVTSYNVVSCELRKYENYSTSLDTYEVTNDGGNTWESILMDGNVHTFVSPGNELGFRITMNRTLSTDPSPSYESVCLLYK